MRKRRGAAALLAAAAMLASSACTGAETAVRAADRPAPEVHYGVLSCFTGRLASLGEAALQGAQVAQAVINEAGGVLGRRLEIDHADTSCDPNDALPATERLLRQGVSGVIGPETQEIDAVEPILRGAKVIDEFQGGDTSRDHQSDPYWFRDSPSDSQLGVAMALYARQKGYLRAATLFYDDPAAQTFQAPIEVAYHKLGGQIVAAVTVAAGQTSYRAQVAQILRSHPQVIFTQTDGATAAVLFRDFRAANALAVPFIGSDVTGGADYLHAIGLPTAHDHLVSVYGTTVGDPARDAYTQNLHRLRPHEQALANATYAYDSTISLALAQTAANSLDGQRVKDSMTYVTNPPGRLCATYLDCITVLARHQKIDYQGASGNLDYDSHHNAYGPYGVFRATSTGGATRISVLTAHQLAAATP